MRSLDSFGVIFSFLLFAPCDGSLSDVTNDIFGDKRGVVASFGDFNADKMTDIFVLTNDTNQCQIGKCVYLLQAQQELTEKKPSFVRKDLIMESSNSSITGIAPGDFNGDSQMDLLVIRKNPLDSYVSVQIYWGNSSTGNLDKDFLLISETFKDQPSIIDANGDMIPDIIGETSNGTRCFFLFSLQGKYEVQVVRNGSELPADPLRIPQSSGFFDVDGDLVADLCMVSVKNETIQFEIWLNQQGSLTWKKTINSPPALKKAGRASFYDLNDNQEINIVLPGCLDNDCKQSVVYVWGNEQWYLLDINFTSEGETWTFSIDDDTQTWTDIPFMLRFGDYNLDGFPDALGVLRKSSNMSQAAAFLLWNVPCSNCSGFSRTFYINFDQPISNPSEQPLLAAFCDLMENGILDILLTVYPNNQPQPELRALEQDFTNDAYFLKVMVVSGLCMGDCPNGHQPYGVNQVGPGVRFQTTTSTGFIEIGVASQLSQSAYFSLQLPFEVFGLGQTPNFVDWLEVGVQNPHSSGKRKSWPSIIPNAQVVVIPNPPDSPSRWRTKLYVTPSRLVLLTGASLLGTCAFISIVIALLHWRERAEDKKEKLQEAQRFHFDAM